MNKLIFLNFWTITFDAVFDIQFVNLFAFTKVWEICYFNDKNPKRNIWIQKIPFFKMAKSPVKNVRAEKRDSANWSEMRWFSFQKIDLHFVHWNPGPNRPNFRDIRGRIILLVKNTIKWGSTFNHHNHKNGSTIDIFLNVFVQALIIGQNRNEKHCGGILFLFLWYFFPKIITFRLFRTHILRNLVGWHHEDLLY